MKSLVAVRCASALAWACLAASPALAEGWTLSKLNPFKTETKEVSPYVPQVDDSYVDEQDPPTSGFKFPKLKMPKFGMGEDKPPAPPSSQPSTMQKLGQGTKKFFSKTADVLTPWDNDKKPASRRVRATGVRRSYAGSPSAMQEEKKSSFLPSWLSKKEEPKSSATVGGFLAQPRPRF